jgi:hypothetical protein
MPLPFHIVHRDLLIANRATCHSQICMVWTDKVVCCSASASLFPNWVTLWPLSTLRRRSTTIGAEHRFDHTDGASGRVTQFERYELLHINGQHLFPTAVVRTCVLTKHNKS